MTISMVVKRITADRSMLATTSYMATLVKSPLGGSVWYKKYLLWFVLALIVGICSFFLIGHNMF